MNENRNLFDDSTMEEFCSTETKKTKIPKAATARALQLLLMLDSEKNTIKYIPKFTVDMTLLKRLHKYVGTKQLYCMIWTVAKTPPLINGSNAILNVRYISYHAQRILESEEYIEMLQHFDEDAIARVEKEIDAYVESNS